MDCRKFELQLESFLTDKLPPASRQECRTHLESCASCRELLELAAQEPIQMGPARTEELVQAVLEKTSGKSCIQAHELLPDYVDGVLAAASGELVRRHLENCRSCQQIHQTLKDLKEVLPVLAQMDPGSSFTWKCMHSLRQAQNKRSQPWIWPGRIWGRLLARPRLAWESAYILTLLLFVFLRLSTFVPGLSPAAAISTLQTKSAQMGVSIADTFKKSINEWSLSVADRQDRWAKSSSMRKEEVFSTIVRVKDKTKQYSRSTSSAVIRFPHSIWNGIVGQVEKALPKDRSTT
jgi:anti-sigma factor RsiW